MPRSPRPDNLTINLTSATEAQQSSSGPQSSPINVDLSSFGGEFGEFGSSDGAPQTVITTLPPLPASPPTSPRYNHNREPSKNLLSNFKNRTRDQKEQQRSGAVRQAKDEDDAYRPGSSSMSKIYHLRKNPGSTPELSLVGSAENVGKAAGDANNAAVTDSRPQPSPSHHSEDSTSSKRKEKPFRNPLTRSKSIRRDSESKSQRPDARAVFEQPPNTAPLQSEWPGQDMTLLRAAKGKDRRGKSVERAAVGESDDNVAEARAQVKDKDKEKERSSGFKFGSKNVVSKATKTGGGFLTRLGKIGRSSSNNEREVSDTDYQMVVINQPLIEQTRMTRISKDLSKCRDKTEYWMPSLPWRCIDYLNLNCESEGLYRVPGSAYQIKIWQRRFDTELDIDLLDEKELYDPNTIGSILKSWLRDLPTEILPATVQSKLAIELERDNPEYTKIGQPAPQKLRDALSELPPFNYYVLFAITCHLSLLLSHKERNRMDLNNLSICIGPCLRMDRWLFNYLVGDWRHCWQGCFSEKQYLETEKAIEQGDNYVPPASSDDSNAPSGSTQSSIADERAVHSSGSSNPDSQHEDARPSLASEENAVSQQRRMRRPDENARPQLPETYRPAGTREFSNGSVTTLQRSPVAGGSAVEVKRPATAEDRKGGEETPSKASTPKVPRHSRSRSDIPTTPVLVGGDYSFPPLPERTRYGS